MPGRPRVLSFDVSVDRDRTAHSGLGGAPIARDDAWWAEHLVLAGLARCTLTSLDYHAHGSELTSTGSATARGLVTQRESDGRYAFNFGNPFSGTHFGAPRTAAISLAFEFK